MTPLPSALPPPPHAPPESDDFIRLPGLFRRWELEQVIEVGVDFHIEGAGATADGTSLFAVYARSPASRG